MDDIPQPVLQRGGGGGGHTIMDDVPQPQGQRHSMLDDVPPVYIMKTSDDEKSLLDTSDDSAQPHHQ